MQETEIKLRSESQPIEKPVQESRSKTTFDDAEYQRWSENLRNRTRSKGK